MNIPISLMIALLTLPNLLPVNPQITGGHPQIIQIANRCASKYEGVFLGTYEDPASDYRYSANLFECFQTKAQCRRWLYPLQSKYTEGQVIAKCRKL